MFSVRTKEYLCRNAIISLKSKGPFSPAGQNNINCFMIIFACPKTIKKPIKASYRISFDTVCGKVCPFYTVCTLVLKTSTFHCMLWTKYLAKLHLSELMSLWHLSHKRPAKAQASMSIHAVSPEPSLFAHMKYGSRRRVRPKSDICPHTMAAHARLKNEFTGDEKYLILMRWLICQCVFSVLVPDSRQWTDTQNGATFPECTWELTNLTCKFWDLIPFDIAELWVKDTYYNNGCVGLYQKRRLHRLCIP